jgi:hypothetical protein
MAAQTIIPNDVVIGGTLAANTITLSANSVTDAKVASAADIAATKLRHQHRAMWQQPNTAATAETRVLHLAYGDGDIISVKAGSIAAAIGDSTVTIDIKKNGTTILSGTIQLDNANSAYVAEAGSLSVLTFVAGDVLTAHITISAGSGTLPTGVYVAVTVNEKPAP